MDWLKIISFHREIVLRTQEGYYRIGVAKEQRYSGLEDHLIDSFSGPWHLAGHDMKNERLLAMTGEETEPRRWAIGLVAFQFNGDWCPVFIKDVTVSIHQEGDWMIQPIQANWDVSPQFVQLLGKVAESGAADLLETVATMMERAANRSQAEEKRLTECLKKELLYSYPQVKDLFGERTLNAMLILAPEEAGQYDKNIMKDYDVLIRRLTENPNDIGGLSLINGVAADCLNAEEGEVHHIIPLNPSQMAAVSGILMNQPITVISGPPGCGKSQVVVSALFNSWMFGRSVLFASQNNKAVDVVKERILSLDLPIPIVARAGSIQQRNLKELPKSIANAVSGLHRRKQTRTRDELKRRIQELTGERNKLQTFIDSKTPVRLEETYRAALIAYHTALTSYDSIMNIRKSFDVRIGEICEQETIDSIDSSFVQPMTIWIGMADTYKARLQESMKKESVLNAACVLLCEQFERQRDTLPGFQRLQPEAAGHLSWMSLATWLAKCRKEWETSLDNVLQYPEETNEIAMAHTATHVMQTVRELEEIVSMTTSFITKYGDVLDSINHFRIDSARISELVSGFRLASEKGLPLIMMDEWMRLWKRYGLRLDAFCLPFTVVAQAKRRIRDLEHQLIATIPLQTVSFLGDPSKNRSSWVPFMEMSMEVSLYLQRYGKQISIIESHDNEVRRIRDAIRFVQDDLEVPKDGSSVEWYELQRTTRRLLEQYQLASVYHEKMSRFQDGVEVVKKQHMQLMDIDRHEVAAEAAFAFVFDEVDNAYRQFLRAPSGTTRETLHDTVFDQRIKKCLTEWNGLIQIAGEIENHKQALAGLPKKETLCDEWLRSCPAFVSRTSFPLTGFDASALPEYEKLQQVNLVKKEWEDFRIEEMVRLTKVAESEYVASVEKLDRIIKEYPGESISDELLGILKKIRNEKPGYQWPVERIGELIRNKDVAKLEAGLSNYDVQIRSLVKEMGVSIWLERADRLLLDEHGLTRIVRDFEGNRLTSDNFAVLMHTFPIWITTSQSTSGIPLEPGIFDTLIIDEATQCTLTNLLPLIYRAKSIVVIGDAEQLPSIPGIGENTERSVAQQYGLDEDELYIYGHGNNDVFHTAARFLPGGLLGAYSLVEHYRSIPQIIVFANRYIYNQRLVLKRPISDEVFALDSRVYGIHRIHVKGTVRRGPNGKSWINEPEGNVVIDVISNLVGEHGISGRNIGVVTPFSAQADHLKELLGLNVRHAGILVGSAHTFQGDEREIMIFSSVVADNMKESSLHWVQHPHNLVNVAITRARNALFVVGDFVVMQRQDGILGHLADYLEDIETVKKASMAEYKLLTYLGMQGVTPRVHQRIRDVEVDFVIEDSNTAVRLAIEVDGKQHETESVLDHSRDVMLQSFGYDVYRVSARDVMETPNVIVADIMKRLAGEKDNMKQDQIQEVSC